MSATGGNSSHANAANSGSSNDAENAKNGMLANIYLSIGSSVGTGIAQSRAISAQGDYEKSVADTNAKLAQLQGKEALSAGDAEAARKEEQNRLQVGAARAASAASGTDVSSDTVTRNVNAIREIGAADELTIKNNAARTAWGFQTQSIMDTFKGQFAQLTAKAQSEQTLVTGGLKAVSGPMSIYGNYLRYTQRYDGRQASPGKTSNIPMGSGSDDTDDYEMMP